MMSKSMPAYRPGNRSHMRDVASLRPRTLRHQAPSASPSSLRRNVETWRHPPFSLLLHLLSHVNIHRTTVRHELEQEVSEPAGLSIPDALPFDCASFVLSCIQLCNTCLSCPRSCLRMVQLLFQICDSLLFQELVRPSVNSWNDTHIGILSETNLAQTAQVTTSVNDVGGRRMSALWW